MFLHIWHKGLWWPKIREDIAREINTCVKCLRNSTKKFGYHPLIPIVEARPGDGWAIDLFFMGKFTIFIVIDIASGFLVLLESLLSKKKHVIATCLWKHICVFGPQRYLISDNGGEFVNNVLGKLLGAIGVQHRTISSYHPQANGKVERSILDIKAILKKHCEGNFQKATEFLPYIQLTYNTQISSRTKSTPYALMFGKPANAFKDYRSLGSIQPQSDETIQKIWENINNNIYPSILKMVESREEQRAAKWDSPIKL
jgi:hypothetical protein